MVLQVYKINEKLTQLDEYIQNVYSFRDEPKNEFEKVTKVELGAERAIEKSCQCALDIGNMIIANLGLKSPPMYRYIPIILAEAKIINKQLENKMIQIATFRNYLVHEYADLKPEEIYQIVHHDIDDLVEFAKQIVEFMEKYQQSHSGETTPNKSST